MNNIEKITLRIYNFRVKKRIDDLYKKMDYLYDSKNQFFNDIIRRGLEDLEQETKNSKTILKNGELINELKILKSSIDKMMDVMISDFKNSYIISHENQTLINRIYGAVFKMANNDIVDEERFNKGLFDSLPNNFEEITNYFIKECERYVSSKG